MNYAQSLSRVLLFVTPCTIVGQAPLSSVISWSLLKFMSIELVMLSHHLTIYHLLLLLPLIFPSIRVFSNGSVLCTKWSKYWSFCFSNSPSNEYSGLIFFRIDWFDLLPVQGTLKISSTTILWHSACFMIQLSYLYMTTGKIIALIFGSKVMSLLLNSVSGFLIAFLPGNKCISW